MTARRPQWLPDRDDAAGIVLAFAVGGAALGIARALPPTPYLSDVLIALLFGALLVNTPLRRIVGLTRPGHEREADRHASGLRYVGKWVLRLSIVLMGLKVRTELLHAGDLALVFGVIAVALPSAWFVAHSVAAPLEVRRPLADLLAGGTMICGVSAVNAVAPVVGARREEQGVATAAVFLFSVTALLLFQPIAHALGLGAADAGVWSGLAVNDLSSAIAVGKQMGGDGGVMAAASKSARVLMLAPVIVVFALLRGGRAAAGAGGVRSSALAAVPRYLFGYLALAGLRAAGDRLWPGAAAWNGVLVVDKWAVDVLLLAVAASIGLHLDLRTLLSTSVRALIVGGATSVWMASITLAMVALAAAGQAAAAAVVGGAGVLFSFLTYRLVAGRDAPARLLRKRFAAGMPLSLAEATDLLDRIEAEGTLDDDVRRRVMKQLHPSIGELIPARESPLVHGDGSRWTTYWQGKSGWALVAVIRDPGSATPIHAHPHRLFARTIEGAVEELRFAEPGAGASAGAGETLELVERRILGHDELVETDGLATVHAIRVVGRRMAIDLQLRGPEPGTPGRLLRTAEPLDLATLTVGTRFQVSSGSDDRPGHRGDGPSAGRYTVPGP